MPSVSFSFTFGVRGLQLSAYKTWRCVPRGYTLAHEQTKSMQCLGGCFGFLFRRKKSAQEQELLRKEQEMLLAETAAALDEDFSEDQLNSLLERQGGLFKNSTISLDGGGFDDIDELQGDLHAAPMPAPPARTQAADSAPLPPSRKTKKSSNHPRPRPAMAGPSAGAVPQIHADPTLLPPPLADMPAFPLPPSTQSFSFPPPPPTLRHPGFGRDEEAVPPGVSAPPSSSAAAKPKVPLSQRSGASAFSIDDGEEID
ncbi:hypothetical protein PAPYR_5404 [Paratrimastix pyriformis]|uniref:Uncharacterized protein n=1 Tax=Paratrimastix pyriformis TaxID=342808 RepID=A0ABQ8UKC6_9EUKA|nr:hypothetical protein PAPYR_5404 [Paratrimastix pyriformis]